MLAQRVLSAVVLAPLLLLVVHVGGVPFLLVAAALSLLAQREFYLLLRRAGYSPLWPAGILLGPAFLLDGYQAGLLRGRPDAGVSGAPPLNAPLDSWLLSLPAGQIAQAALALALVASLVFLVIRQQPDRASFADWAVTWAPPLYAGFLLAFLVSLRLLPSGDRWIFLVLGITWSTDSAAYFVGRAIGQRRFFARISPRKTLEGAVGGLVAGVLAGVLIAGWFGWDLPRLLPLLLLAPVAAVVGDLAESLIKRQLRVKDAGTLIPGHGGAMDRMDSVLFVGVLAYFWALWVGGAS